MSDAKNEAVIVLLATDALEAARHEPAVAAILLIDAALSILVTCEVGAVRWRETAEVLSAYIEEQVGTIIRVTGGAA
jgi:hypothetical protein